MRRRAFLIGALASGFGAPANAQGPGGRTSADVAREIFRGAVARALRREASSFRILPEAGADGDALYQRLRTASLFAWEAVDKDLKVLLRGFAGPGPGVQIAFDGFQLNLDPGPPVGIQALLRTANMLGPRPMAADALSERVAWCLSSDGQQLIDFKLLEQTGWSAPEGAEAPKLHAMKGGAMLVYTVMKHGLTGSWSFERVTLSVAADYTYVVGRENLR